MPVLGYWKIRGVAQPIRLLLSYLQLPFDDVLYERGDAPDFSGDQWLDVKYILGLAFPNLPYYIDGETKLTQSNAILRHFGRKYDMVGQTDEEKDVVNIVLDHTVDVRLAMDVFTYGTSEDMTQEKYYEELPAKLALFEDHLADKPWFAGQKMTIADFPVYELLEQHLVFGGDCLKAFPILRAFVDRFRALPAIKAYMESDRFIKSPVNDKQALHIG